MIKKLISISLVALVMCMSLTTGAVFAFDYATVSVDEASRVAQRYVEKFSAISFPDWTDAKVSEPETYYRVDGGKAAYEFTVLNGKGPAGFIIISAIKDWIPVLEMSGGKAPSAFLPEATEIAVEKGYIGVDEVSETKPHVLYWGALTYSVQIGAKMESERKACFLPTGQFYDVPEQQPQLRMNQEQARAAWDSLEQDEVRDLLRYTEDYISGVPAYYQVDYIDQYCDEYDEYASYPWCVGIANDPWSTYDGCAPIAGAMIFGYWDNNGYSSSSDDEELIDYLHEYMYTDYECG